MTKQEKNEVIELLKGKFSQYNNFYVTDTESLTVAQVTKLRSVCFNKQVEMKVAKNTLIKKALEGLDAEKYAGVYDSLHKVTALLFSENPKDPAMIISSFRKENNNERPVLKAAFINGDVFVGDNQLKALTQIKTKNELIGEVIGLLLSPIQRVIGALQNKDAAKPAEEVTEAPVAEATAPAAETPVAEAAAPETIAAPEAPVAEAPVAEAPVAETPAADIAPEEKAPEA
ncbi:MAG: 50S ribosomal protein L10 [Ferruginibacter sp.]|nr:50S ribosomal protein L10 [Ferruginibacter sp.]